MNIAILGATSHIAKDLILLFHDRHQLVLYSRRPAAMMQWLSQITLKRCINRHIDEFSDRLHYDAILNFVGAGDPETIRRLGKRILTITETYDQMVLGCLQEHPDCLYIFMSSGAVFGDNFSTPVDHQTPSIFPINNLLPQYYYGLAKAQSEYRHRMSDHNIVYLRIFNYFSSAVNLQNESMICGMLRSILESREFVVDRVNVTRDYVGPKDFYQMIKLLLEQETINTAVDLYSRLPISKDLLIDKMKDRYGLRVSVRDAPVAHATGVKENYYSINLAANSLGYRPTKTSIETIFEESDKILKYP
ncbi:MAG: NAD-dependent epimerase/dehydratase family protein [Cyanobium sp.]